MRGHTNTIRTFALFWCCITSNFVIRNCSSQILQQFYDIDLSTYNKTDPSTRIFSLSFNLAQGNAVLSVINAPQTAGFFVVQAHSLFTNISLAHALDPVNHVRGTNVGLVQKTGPYFDQHHEFDIDYVDSPIFETVLVTLIIYKKNDPIPGGCNMEFPTEIAPYQMVRYNESIIQVDAQPASIVDDMCEHNPSRLEMYHMFLYERELSVQSYFDGIRKMMTVEEIKRNGKLVPVPVGKTNLRRLYAAYRGMGSVFAVVATFGKFSSAYVPAVTYACNVNNWDLDCIGPVSITWKILCSFLIFLGLFTCYFGHRFFKTQMFIFGFVFGGFISFVSASLYDSLSVEQGVVISVIFGSIYGAVWTIFWWRFGSPILSVLLPVAFVGYLISCLFFYYAIGDFGLFQNDANYWATFFGIAFPITMVLLVSSAMYANVLACGFLGATAVVISLDHYVGGNLRYAVLNNVRRACVSKFNYAIVDPPFQYRDGILCGVWFFLVITGTYCQLRQQRGKAPFPPPVYAMRLNSELTPLLGSNNRRDTFPIDDGEA